MHILVHIHVLHLLANSVKRLRSHIRGHVGSAHDAVFFTCLYLYSRSCLNHVASCTTNANTRVQKDPPDVWSPERFVHIQSVCTDWSVDSRLASECGRSQCRTTSLMWEPLVLMLLGSVSLCANIHVLLGTFLCRVCDGKWL